jgi:hypothetical protein
MDGHEQVSYDAVMHPQDSGAQTSQQSSPQATRRATPRTDSPSATQPASTRDAEQGELADLREQFPGFRIWREITGERVRFVARRARPGLNPPTIVTADIGELRAALHPSRNAGLVRFSPTTPSKIHHRADSSSGVRNASRRGHGQ